MIEDVIMQMTASHFDVTVEMLKAKTRKREIVIARQTAQYFIKEMTNFSLKSIGSMFGGRDHSTVINSLTAVSDMLDTDKVYNKRFFELKEMFMASDAFKIAVNLKEEGEKDFIDNELSHLIPNS